jgi:hypothetical protein
MADHGCGEAGRNPPHAPGHTADGQEQCCPRELLSHPAQFDRAVEATLGNAVLQDQLGRMRQLELAMQLPPPVAQDRGAVRQIGMAARLALCPIAQIVLADHAGGTSHPDERAQVHKQPLEPQRAAIGTVDEPPMHAERMAKAHRCGRRDQEHQPTPGELHWPAEQRDHGHAGDPQGLHWFSAHAPRDRARGIDHAGRPEGRICAGQRLTHKIGHKIGHKIDSGAST